MNRRDVLKASLGSLIVGPLIFGREGRTALAQASHTDDLSVESHWTAESDVVWTTPSGDVTGAMPMGNGTVGISLWVEENGDLLFLISRTDSFSEVARLLKVGRVRMSLSPNPFMTGQPFQQALHLRDGVCEITAGTGPSQVVLHVFVDSDHPVIHLRGETSGTIQVNATVESWRTEVHTVAPGEEQSSAWTMSGAPFPLIESADVFPKVPDDTVAWYHRNEMSTAFTATMKTQSLETVAHTVEDPLRHRTFGGWLTGHGFVATGPNAISVRPPVKSFALRIACPCAQTKTAPEWIDAAHQEADKTSDAAAAQKRTSDWWRAYWDRSRVVVSGDHSAILPTNAMPLRIGYDSNHQNVFPGTLGRTSVYGRVLSDAEIAQLSSAGQDQPAPITIGLLAHGDGTPREIASETLDLTQGFTLEAWIKADGSGPGRIFDKLTAGQEDGFLLDTYPKDTMRLIVSSQKLESKAGSLKADTWTHVAATVDNNSGAIRVYLNGQKVAEAAGSTARSPITRGYTLQRYMQACGGRGPYPIKFNGGMFTVEPIAEGKPFNPDWRAWGDAHWYQNVRHMYHPMAAGGDIEMTDPFFHLYERVRPLAEARTKLYHGADGSYFPETMTVWGTYANSDYGWDRTDKQPKDVDSTWWRYAWNQGPELVALMLDRWDVTQEEAFLKTRLLPIAVSVLTYFDTRFLKDGNGRVILDPAQAVETFWTGVINDMPTTAGLNAITARLCALPTHLTTSAQRTFFAHMKAAAPVVPIEEVTVDGMTKKTLAPAQKYDPDRSNVENPELYAVWPFRLYGVGLPDIEVARTAYAQRVNHLPVGWGYDGNCAAMLGMADEAAHILQIKCANSNGKHRWPATWGPNFDWLPDQNHGGNLLETTQLMLLQSVGDKIYLLPAWPSKWDVSFRLHAPQKTVVECVYKAGKIEHLTVSPSSRQKDIVLPNG